jgi:hypothetical protein
MPVKRTARFHIAGLVVLSSIVVLAAVPVWAQVALRSVKPDSARAGEEVELIIQGAGFCGPASVQIGAFEAADVRVESDSAIRATIYIPGDALPGPYPVLVIVDCGGPQETFSAALEEGFTVLEPAGGGGYEGGGDDGLVDGWLLPVIILIGIGVIVLGGGTLAVILAVRARQATLKKQTQVQQAQEELHLQEQAEEGELPERCQSGKVKVIRDKPELKPGLWKVAGLTVTLYDEAQAQRDGERRGKGRAVPDELIERIDKAARNRLLWVDSEKLTAEVIEIGRALAAHIIAWQAVSESGRDVRLEPEITGGEGSVKFTLYRCVGPPDWWQKVRSWQAKVQAVRHFAQEFRGPAADEAPEAYRAVLEKGVTIYVRNLVCEVSLLWDTQGVGVSVEVSLE